MQKRSLPPFLATPPSLSLPFSATKQERSGKPRLPADALPAHSSGNYPPEPGSDGLCDSILHDSRYYAASPNMDEERCALSAAMRRALGAVPPSAPARGVKSGLRHVTKLFEDEKRVAAIDEQRRAMLDADTAILAQALAFACSGADDARPADYRQANRLLQRLSAVDLPAVIRKPSVERPDDAPLWRAVLLLASSHAGMQVLRKICPWPNRTPDALAIFLRSAALLAIRRGGAERSLRDRLGQFPEPKRADTAAQSDAEQASLSQAMQYAFQALERRDIDDAVSMNLLKVNNGLNAEEEKSIDRLFRKLTVWCDRTLTRESMTTRLFDATLRKAFAPTTKKRPFDALTHILASEVDKPGAVPASMLRSAAGTLHGRFMKCALPDPDKQTLRRLVAGKIRGNEAALILPVRRMVLEQFLKRRYALLDGARLNEREIREILRELDAAWTPHLSDDDFRCSLPTRAQRMRWRDHIVDLIRAHAGPLGKDLLKTWSSELNQDASPHRGSSSCAARERLPSLTSCARENTASRGRQTPEKLFPASPSRQELADVLNALCARLERGGSFRFSSNGTFRFSIAPLTEAASGVVTGGLVSVTVDAGISAGKEVVFSVEHTADGIELFLGREKMVKLPVAVEARSGLSGCFLFNASAGARLSAAYCRRDREGVLIRLPLSADKAAREAEKHEFGELIGQLILYEETQETRYEWLLRNDRRVTLSVVGGKRRSVTGSAEVSASASLAGKLLEAEIGLGLHGTSKTAIHRVVGRHGQLTTDRSGQSELALRGTVSGLAIRHGRRLLSRHGVNGNDLAVGKIFRLTEKPYDNFQVTEASGQAIKIACKQTYRNHRAFLDAIRHALPLTSDEQDVRGQSAGLRFASTKAGEIEQFFRDVETASEDAIFETNRELKPHALQLLNRYRAIAANAMLMFDAPESADMRRVTAILDHPDSWRLRSIARISTRNHDKRSGINLYSFFYSERKEAFRQRLSEMVSIPSYSEFPGSPVRSA